MGVCAMTTMLRMPGIYRFIRVPVRPCRRNVGVRDDRVIPLHLQMGRIAVMHVRKPRFGDRSAKGKEQDDGDEPAKMHAVTALNGGAMNARCSRGVRRADALRA